MSMLFLSISYPVVFLLGWLMCAIFTTDSCSDDCRRAHKEGEFEGYRQGYMDCYNGFMGETAQYNGDMNENE